MILKKMMFFMYYQYLFSYTNPIKKFKSVPNGLKFYSYTNFKMESDFKSSLVSILNRWIIFDAQTFFAEING